MNSKLRHRVLRDWIGDDLPTSEVPPPADLREALQKAFSKFGLSDRLRESTLTESWADLVGPTLAAHCSPAGVRKGVLCVMIDHPAWLHQITLAHKSDILQAVQQHFPHLKIKGLSLRIS